MKLIFLPILILFFIISATSFAQNHFYPIGDFTSAMNINVLEAKINGVDLEKGDEIGIFSGDLCVGSASLDNSLERVFDTITKSAVAGSDDSETAEQDGFSIGGEMGYRFWDASEKIEISVKEIKCYNPSNGNEISSPFFSIGATAYVSLNTVFNYTPKPDAGPDQILYEGESGQLDGTGSSDLNLDSLSFSWYDLDDLGLNVLDIASPTFNAPKVNADSDFRVVLVVSDGNETSVPDTSIVTVLNVLSGPVANAGEEVIEVNELEVVYLDGSKSFDPDGQSIAWHWELSQSGINLVNSDSTIANFIAPEIEADTTIYAELSVTNSSALFARDTVFITVKNINQVPLAIAVSDTEVQEGEQVVLDGSASSDPDDGPSNLSYQWNSLNGGEIIDHDKMNAVFTAPWLLADSTFFFSLVAFDGEKYSSPDTIAITVLHTNLPPIADAGADVTVNEGEEFVLNGKSSFDPEGKILLCEWTSEYLILDATNSSDPIFIAPETHKDTTVFVTLKVSDNELWSITDTVWITIQHKNKAPEWGSLQLDSAYLGKSYRGNVEVYDYDIYDSIRISFLDLPSWLSYVDNGDGTAELFTDSIPHVDSLLGELEIELQASDGMAMIDTILVLNLDIMTGIHKTELSAFKVFPNPVHDWLTIQFEDQAVSERMIRLYTASGILLRQELATTQKTRFNLSYLSKGFYLLQIIEKDLAGTTTKIVVE